MRIDGPFVKVRLDRTLQHYSSSQRATIVKFLREIADRIEQDRAGPKEAEFMAWMTREEEPWKSE